jgi:hypothetical protein
VSVSSAKASGLTAAVGPGLRLWVHEAIAIGYTVRLRLDQLSGDAGALPSAPGQASPTASASSANVRFEGAFQILGVF